MTNRHDLTVNLRAITHNNLVEKMRLVNTTTLNVETFQDGRIPAYAILSHRWMGDGEVTIQDMAQQHRQWMPAWTKITMSCQQALMDGLGYIWIDTCCIDKTSSAELSEAINSMYKWYASAKPCRLLVLM